MSFNRPLDTENPFEVALNRALGDRIRESDDVAAAAWGALSNVDWTHESGATYSASFRQAGGLIAAIRGEGGYMDWYCSSEAGSVSPEIHDAMGKEGWTHHGAQHPAADETYWKGR